MAPVINDQPASAEAQIPAHNSPCGIYVKQNVTEIDSEYFCLPLPISFRICLYKAILLQAWTGPEGSRRLRLLDFMIIAT
jgi:hypothetical protein